jgi:hypothetical protein
MHLCGQFCNFCSIQFKVTQWGAEWSVFLTQYCAGGKIEKNDVGRACGAYGGGERSAQGVGGEARGKEATGETQTKMGG